MSARTRKVKLGQLRGIQDFFQSKKKKTQPNSSSFENGSLDGGENRRPKVAAPPALVRTKAKANYVVGGPSGPRRGSASSLLQRLDALEEGGAESDRAASVAGARATEDGKWAFTKMFGSRTPRTSSSSPDADASVPSTASNNATITSAVRSSATTQKKMQSTLGFAAIPRSTSAESISPAASQDAEVSGGGGVVDREVSRGKVEHTSTVASAPRRRTRFGWGGLPDDPRSHRRGIGLNNGMAWLLRRQVYGSSAHRLAQVTEQCARSTFALNSYWRYQSRSTTLNNNYATGAPVRPSVGRRRLTALEFDSQGILLASARTDGHIAIYDMDEFNWTQQQCENLEVFGLSQKSARSPSVEPYILIGTRNDISSLAWSPVQDSTILACSFFSQACIDLFDLETASDDPLEAGQHPLHRLVAGDSRGRGRGNTGGLSFADANSVVALDSGGTMRLWDLRCQKSPRWVLRRAAPEKKTNVTGIAGGGSHCLCLSSDATTFFCSGGDRVFSWDARNLEFPVLSTTCSPKALTQWSLNSHVPPELRSSYGQVNDFYTRQQFVRSCDDNACISALVAHPRNPREWWVVRSDGLAGQFDFLSRRFVTCQRFSRPQKVLHDGEDELRAPTGNASAHTPAGFFHGGGHPVFYAASRHEPFLDVVDADAQGSDLTDERGTAVRLAHLGIARKPRPGTASASGTGAEEGVSAEDEMAANDGSEESPPKTATSPSGRVASTRAPERMEYQFGRHSRISLGADFATSVAAHPKGNLLVVGMMGSANLQVFGC